LAVAQLASGPGDVITVHAELNRPRPTAAATAKVSRSDSSNDVVPSGLAGRLRAIKAPGTLAGINLDGRPIIESNTGDRLGGPVAPALDRLGGRDRGRGPGRTATWLCAARSAWH
jgi:hypothetical protein